MKSFRGMSAVAYLRWSKDEQCASLKQQRAVITSWAAKYGVSIINMLMHGSNHFDDCIMQPIVLSGYYGVAEQQVIPRHSLSAAVNGLPRRPSLQNDPDAPYRL